MPLKTMSNQLQRCLRASHALRRAGVHARDAMARGLNTSHG